MHQSKDEQSHMLFRQGWACERNEEHHIVKLTHMESGSVVQGKALEPFLEALKIQDPISFFKMELAQLVADYEDQQDWLVDCEVRIKKQGEDTAFKLVFNGERMEEYLEPIVPINADN